MLLGHFLVYLSACGGDGLLYIISPIPSSGSIKLRNLSDSIVPGATSWVLATPFVHMPLLFLSQRQAWTHMHTWVCAHTHTLFIYQHFSFKKVFFLICIISVYLNILSVIPVATAIESESSCHSKIQCIEIVFACQ